MCEGHKVENHQTQSYLNFCHVRIYLLNKPVYLFELQKNASVIALYGTAKEFRF